MPEFRFYLSCAGELSSKKHPDTLPYPWIKGKIEALKKPAGRKKL